MAGRRPRFVGPHGGTFEVTCTAMHRRLLLVPSLKVNAIILGALGRGLARYPRIWLHAFVYLSNHSTHLITTPDAHTLASFMGLVNSKIARELGRLYGWRDKFWSRRYTAIEVLGETAFIARLKYVMAQGAKGENLVASPREWPGATSVPAMIGEKTLRGIWNDRTAQWHAERRERRKLKERDFELPYDVTLAPLPCWVDMTPEEHQEKCRALLHEIEAEAAERYRKSGIKPMGPARILAQKPLSRPKRSKKSPRPLCHASDKETRRAYSEALQMFLEAYERASRRLRQGIVEACNEFPPGCFLPRLPFQPVQNAA